MLMIYLYKPRLMKHLRTDMKAHFCFNSVLKEF